MDHDRERRRIPSGPPIWRYATLGTELAGGLVGFVLLGWAIDRALGSAPVAIVTAAILGCVGGMVHLFRRALQMQRDMQQDAARRKLTDDAKHRLEDDGQR